MGYVLLEAMALNIPIVSTTTIGAKEVLGNDFPGLINLFPEMKNNQKANTELDYKPLEKNTEILAEKLVQVINNPLGFTQKLSDEYSVDIVANKFETLTQIDVTEQINNQRTHVTTV